MGRPDIARRILAAVRALFEREGPAAVSMRRVAGAVGITPMAIYRHFPDREALLKRISDHSFSETARHRDTRKSGGDPIAQLIAIQMIYLDYALAHPHLFDLRRVGGSRAGEALKRERPALGRASWRVAIAIVQKIEGSRRRSASRRSAEPVRSMSSRV